MGGLFDETSFANLTVTNLKIQSLGKTALFSLNLMWLRNFMQNGFNVFMFQFEF